MKSKFYQSVKGKILMMGALGIIAAVIIGVESHKGFTASVTSYDQIRRIGFPLLIVAAAFRVDGLQPCAWIHGKNTMCDIFHRLLISDLKEME